MNKEYMENKSNLTKCRSLKAAAAVVFSIAVLMVSALVVYASPSIPDLHNTQNVTISATSTDGTNTAAILSDMGIYTDRAISDQYKVRDENGNLVATKVSDMIDIAEATVRESGNNGKAVAEAIPTVKEILQAVTDKPEAKLKKEFGISIDELYQLTPMQDFKYEETHNRVIAGESVNLGSRTETLDDGMIEVSFTGTEITKAWNIDDFIIVQVNPKTNKIYYLKMKEYDEKTGDHVIAFPCVGPYMITTVVRQ